jgi:ribonuclease HI
VVEKTLTLAARGVLPVWRTTPNTTVFRDSGLPSAMAALEESKLRFAMRLQTVDDQHPLTRRIPTPMISRGRGAGNLQAPKTKVQRLGKILPAIPRLILRPPHYSDGCRTDPTKGIDKKTTSDEFKKWWSALPLEDITIFSDGSEKYVEGQRYVGYGYAIYQDSKQIANGHGSINSLSHVFEAEAIGAWKGLEYVIRMPAIRHRRIWSCIDSTSVIWCLRGDASSSSQWAFYNYQDAMETHDVRIRWSPGHTGIEGNEAADELANLGAMKPEWDTGLASEPTVSGIRSIFRRLRREARSSWWAKYSANLSKWYKKWELPYQVKPPLELELPRAHSTAYWQSALHTATSSGITKSLITQRPMSSARAATPRPLHT